MLGWLAFWGSPTYRRRLRANVAQAGLDWATARGAVASAGRMVAELPWLWCRPHDQPLGQLVHWEGAERIEAALAANRGLLLLTPHLGCFEVIALAYAERWGATHPFTVMFRPSRQPALRDLVAQSRNRPGVQAAPATLTGVRQMIRALRKGGTVGLLPDQVPPRGMGTWAPFFGRQAYTMTLASRLVQQTDATWLLVAAERLEGGRGWVIRVSAPAEPMPGSSTHPCEGQDPEEVARHAAAVVNQEMERLILSKPDQYLWGYHRYKQPRNPENPPADATGEGS